jgi:hypothetical protein
VIKTSNCSKCKYKQAPYHTPNHSGWCYMFEENFKGVCNQYQKLQVKEDKNERVSKAT